MVMARPPASKSKKIRTGNYYLSWSGLNVVLAHIALKIYVTSCHVLRLHSLKMFHFSVCVLEGHFQTHSKPWVTTVSLLHADLMDVCW